MNHAVVAALLALLSTRHADVELPSLDVPGWHELLRQAVAHGVAPLVHSRLTNAGVTMPQAVRQGFEHCHLRCGLDNLRLLTRLAAPLRQWQAQGIGAIVLKGAYLAQAIYASPALRSMGDADVLVRRADLERAAELLRIGGWRSVAATVWNSPTGGGHQLPTFVLGGVQLELHWAIEGDACPFAIDGDALWQRAVPAEIGGAPALALAPEDLLLHLCLHTAYGHGALQFDNGLRPLCDIAACLQCFEDRIDWTVLVDRARAWRISPSVALALEIVRDLLQSNVPLGVLEKLSAPRSDRACLATATGLVLDPYYHELLALLPVLGRTWLTRGWHRMSRPARWRVLALPGRESLARAYPSIRVATAPLRLAAHGADLLLDIVRLACSRRARRLVERERYRATLLRHLESG